MDELKVFKCSFNINDIIFAKNEDEALDKFIRFLEEMRYGEKCAYIQIKESND